MPEEYELHPALGIFQEIRKGDLLEEMAEKLSELVGAVRATSKVGELTLKLKMKPTAKGVVAVTDELKVKLPEAAKEGTIFYTTNDNGLSRYDPDQMALPEAKKVEEPPANIRKIGG